MREVIIRTYFFLLLTLCSCSSSAHFHEELSRVITSPSPHFEDNSPLYCFFSPPQDWLVSPPDKISVQIRFIKKQEGFCPSLNLAIEPTRASQEEYLEAVQKIHQNHHADRWRYLGKVQTLAGLADLTELDMTTKWGPARLLQLILVHEGSAYIMTASATKKEIASYYGAFQAAFHSLQITKNLLDPIPDAQRREALEHKRELLHSTFARLILEKGSKENAFHDPEFQNALWIPLQKEITEHYADMGAHWQILLLKDIYNTHL